ncbi:hypothetical protein cypCar_00018577 [Cyprinus carpio]|nr:hypothetical protein cypCar_00018577 [Cyprinus carpio]
MVQNMEINVSFLTESEQEFILEVLRRDEELRRLEELRVKKLKAELLEIKRKGAKRGSGKYSERSCGRCQEPMGLLTRSGSQCRVCKHQVCRKCQSVRPNGSWMCTVCAKEMVESKKHETAGEMLLNRAELNSSQTVPVPKPRLKDIALANKSSPIENYEGLDVRVQQRSDTESIEKASLGSSLAETESSHSTPLMQRKEEATAKTSPAGSAVSILRVPANSESPSTSETASLIHHMNACSDSLRDVDRLFKKSVRRVHKLSGDIILGEYTIQKYVKAYLLPDKSKKKTSIKQNINPSFKETLKYSISRTQLMTRTLQLSVWHYDRFGHNAFLGEVEVPMDSYDIDSAHQECMALRGKAAAQPASPFDQYKGELVISLKYVTANKTHAEDSNGKGKKTKLTDGAELHVLIKEAKNLTAMKAGGTCDSFVKGFANIYFITSVLYLLPSKSKSSSKKKTPLVKKTKNPNYNHTFVYSHLSLEQLKDVCLELTVWDRETLSSNDFLGGVRLSLGGVTIKEGKEEWVADSTGRNDLACGRKMISYPDSLAEGTLPLALAHGKGN